MAELRTTRKAARDYGDTGLTFSDMLKEELQLVAPAEAYKEGENPIKFVGETKFEADPRIPHRTIEAAIVRATNRMMKRLMTQAVSAERDVT